MAVGKQTAYLKPSGSDDDMRYHEIIGCMFKGERGEELRSRYPELTEDRIIEAARREHPSWFFKLEREMKAD